MNKKRGAAADLYENKPLLSAIHWIDIASFIESEHAIGRSVTRRSLINESKNRYGIEVSKQTMSNYVSKLGLKYTRLKPKRRTLGEYRREVIREYLITLDNYQKRIVTGEKLFLCTLMNHMYILPMILLVHFIRKMISKK